MLERLCSLSVVGYNSPKSGSGLDRLHDLDVAFFHRDFARRRARCRDGAPTAHLMRSGAPVRLIIPNRDRPHFIKDGDEVLLGVHAIRAPGTLSGTRPSSSPPWALYPESCILEKHPTEFAYDTDPKQIP